MGTGSVLTNSGIKIIMDRTFNADGATTYTAPSVFKIGTGITTPAISDTDVETGVNINGGATKAFESGYPIEDATAKTVTIRSRLASTEGNGNNLTEQGTFNTDGSALMLSHHVHTSFSKSATDELIYEETIIFDNE